MDTAEEPISVGIIGGGISGCVLAVGLLKKGVRVTVYEAMASYEEHGAGIILQPNGVRAVQLIDDATAQSLRANSKHRHLSDDREVFLMIRAGDSDEVGSVGRLYGRIIGAVGSQVVLSRKALHKTFSRMLPAGTVCFNKTLVEAKDLEGSPTLLFSDGSTAKHSIVIGCDGIHSKLRPYISSSESAQPCWSGKYMHRCSLPMDTATAILGAKVANQSNVFVRAHQHIITFPVEGNTQVSIGLCGSAREWPHERWAVPANRAEIMREFSGWSRRLTQLLLAIQPAKKWALFDLPRCSRYASGHLAIMGDAAHASTPFLGAGTSMAVEDALVLSELIGHVEHKAQIKAALQAYDTVRRPRTQNVTMRSRDACQILHLEHVELGDDLNKVARAMEGSGDWFWHIDLEAHVATAKKYMQERSVKMAFREGSMGKSEHSTQLENDHPNPQTAQEMHVIT